MVSFVMLFIGLPGRPWGISPSSAFTGMPKPLFSSSRCLGFGCPAVPTRSSFAAIVPSPFSSSGESSASKLHSASKRYSAEWIDLLDPDSYSSSNPPLPLPGKIDPPRSGAVSFSNPEHDKIFTFGGYAEEITPGDPVPERHVVNDLWKFLPYSHDEPSSSRWGWTKIEDVEECVPGPRLATAISVLPSSTSSQAVLLGGWDPQTAGTGGVILDDVSMLDLESLKWSQLCASDVDAGEKEFSTIPGGPTSRHVAVPLLISSEEGSIQKNVICLHNHRCEDHVLLLSTTSDSVGKDRVCAKWERQPTTGSDTPSSRGLHCAATLSNEHDNTSKAMVIFGGAAKDGSMSNEAFVLDVTTWTWKKLDCDGNVPSARAGACLCPLDEDTVILFGGATPGEGGLVGLNDVWTLTIDMDNGKGKWKCLVLDQNDVDGNENENLVRPPGRNAATLTQIGVQKLMPKGIVSKYDTSSEDDSYFLLQGGWYPFRKTYNDVFLLRISS